MLHSFALNLSLLLLAALHGHRRVSGQDFNDPGAPACARKHGFCLHNPSCCYSGEYKRQFCRQSARSVCCYTWNTCPVMSQRQQMSINGMPMIRDQQQMLGFGGGYPISHPSASGHPKSVHVVPASQTGIYFSNDKHMKPDFIDDLLA